MELRYVAGVYAGNIKPSPFLCLTLKMLQIQPEKDIIIEFIKNEDFKYVRALGAFYLRLTGTALDCYKYLEPLLNDYRGIRMQRRDGKFELSHMDELIDSLLRDERVCDVIMPRIQKRHILEEMNELDPRVSVLEDDLEDAESSSEEEEGEAPPEPVKPQENRDSNREHRKRRDRVDRRDRDGSRERKRRRSRSRSRERRPRHRSRDRDRENSRRDARDRSRDRHRRDHRERNGGGSGGRGGNKDEMSVDETNKLRASLGLAPLK
ncbi:hypothetical protein TCAL_06389 [Tigriopus californicus]|uniref:Pre-mRNA-splicing factor 38 n=2 Tax=Tigriopus californicus TaxID=6832 RepID=A0A553PD01_TIGCA|nr:hypothetical protein TCAL_06389 [Tigriopus californicus]|eukprot:TCALIF_06389-PA protein Name:"Similar to prpf38a Pre-mRNA-splicing factor 38A (Xenopus laevis)" AED:0.02 eAED:0.02 QI:157/1/1/1/0/0/3/72/264